jgi:hypothetical protein
MWNRLSGPAVEAHIHGPGTAADVADILVDLAPSAQTQNYGVLFGSIQASDIRARPGQPAITIDSLRALMHSGNVYVDVHTAGFAGGEIRGQVRDPFN